MRTQNAHSAADRTDSLSGVRSILFVCTGNICRSPLAEAHFADLGGAGAVRVDSAGIGNWHAGEPADARMRRTAQRHGLTIRHRARMIESSDIESFDLILAMDRTHHRHLVAMAPREHKHKVRMFREFDPAGNGDVPDPYYGGDTGFEHVWEIVDRTNRAIAASIGDTSGTGRPSESLAR